MPVELQNRLFKYFTDTLQAIIGQARRSGRFDLGILDLGAAGESVKRIKRVRFMRKHATGVAPTELHLLHVEVTFYLIKTIFMFYMKRIINYIF